MDKKISRRSKRPYWLLAVAVVLAAGLWWFSKSQANASVQLQLPMSSVSTAVVQPQPLQESIALRATVLPQHSVFLDVIEGGRVEQRLVEQGSYVEQGQPLVQLTNTQLQLDLISREAQVTEQMNFLRNTQMTIETNRLNLQRDVLDIEFRIATLTRHLQQSEPLVATGVLAQEHLNNLTEELHYQQSRLQLTHERQQQEEAIRQLQLHQLSESVEMLSRNLDFARQNVQNLLVRAPISGYLSEFNVEVGESRSPGSRLGQIDQPDQYKLVASVDEFYLGRIQLGMTARVTLQQQPLELQVSRIDSRVVNNQFQLEFVLPEQLQAKRGQSVNLTLQLDDQQSPVLTLARGPFLSDGGGHFVYVLDPTTATARKQAVQLGRQSAQLVEVRQGLREGDIVITSGYREFQQADIIQLQR